MLNSVLIAGSSIVDLTFYSSENLKFGKTSKGTFQSGLGGKGFNQALACKLSGTENVTFMTAMGRGDPWSHNFIEKLVDSKIQWKVDWKDTQTGKAGIIVDSKGNNQIVVDLGASEEMSPDYLVNNFENKYKVILFQFETSFEFLDTSLRFINSLPNRKDITVIVNPAPATFFHKDWLNMIDILIPNETEHEDLKLFYSPEYFSMKNIIVTEGDKGATRIESLKEEMNYKQFPAAIVGSVLDTAGAGDCFNGAFATKFLETNDIDESIKFANIAAGISATRKGTSASLPTREEIEKFKETQ